LKKPKKTHLGIQLTEPFINGLDEFLERGLCANPQDTIRIALRLLFEKHNIEGFNQLPPEDPRKLISEAIEMLEELSRRIQDG